MKRSLLILLAAVAFGGQAYAFDQITGRVTVIDINYIPTQVGWQMDVGTATCPAGAWLRWAKSDIQNNNAAYAALLAALHSGKRVRVLLVEGDATCMVNSLNPLSD